MKRLFIPFMLMACILMTACNSDEVISKEPEVKTIQFSKQDYSIVYGVGASIGYSNGGGVYKVEVGNPEVIGKAVMDIETRHLILLPIALGESTVTIKDVNTNKSVTINITVTNIHMYFHVNTVEGTNNNPYITQGSKIQLVRTCDDQKVIRIVGPDSQSTIAEGLFGMTKGDEYTLEMSLYGSDSEEPQLFRYSVKANDAVFNLYNQWFTHEYIPVPTNRAISPQSPKLYMQLTDMSNGCKITTMMCQYNNYSIPVE